MTKKQKLRSQADELWRRACFKKYGSKCEICESDYETTPHHYYYKSQFGHLRYEILNGVILDKRCHFKLHHQDPKTITEQIEKIRGKRWLNRLKKKRDNRPKYFNTTVGWYEKNIKLLKNYDKTIKRFRLSHV